MLLAVPAPPAPVQWTPQHTHTHPLAFLVSSKNQNNNKKPKQQQKKCIGFEVFADMPYSARRWTVVDDAGAEHSYADNMVLRGSRADAPAIW